MTDLVAETAAILDGRGKQDAISSAELRDELGIADAEARPNTRALVRTVIETRKIPVVSSSDGYYVAQTRRDLDRYLDSLDGRIGRIVDRKENVREAFVSETKRPRTQDAGEW